MRNFPEPCNWARALKPRRDRRPALDKTTSGLIKKEEQELVSLSVGEVAFVRLWPKLRARGFNTLQYHSYTEPYHCPNKVLQPNIR